MPMYSPPPPTMKKLSFTIHGTPRGKGAPRHSRNGFVYTDRDTRSYMNRIKEHALKAGATPLDLPCSILIEAHFPIPPSYSKTKQRMAQEGKLLYTKKPDTDNISKIKDALNGVAFLDDAQVFMETVWKTFSLLPRLEIIILYSEPEDHPSLVVGSLGRPPMRGASGEIS